MVSTVRCYQKTMIFLQKSELFRVVFLFLLVLYAYHPFISGLNMGAMDARWYQYLLHDAIIQFKHFFVFSVVGQSEFNYIGVSIIRAPFYALLGVFIHLLTFGFLNALFIQHLTVIFTALCSTLLLYFGLSRLAPTLRWYSVFIAFFYITCPGVIGLIYKMDMYYSFMAVTFIPLTIYGLIRINEEGDLPAYFLTTMGLSLSWLSHPPMGLWITTVCLLFLFIQFIVLRKNFFHLLIIPCLFMLLNAWQFVGVFSLGMQDYYSLAIKSKFLDSLMVILKNDTLGAFLPLGYRALGTSFLQLGYTLWGILLFGIFIALYFPKNVLLRILSLCGIFLIALLYVIPGVTYWLWWLLPESFYGVTTYPMQRLYMVLAALTCYIGLLSLRKIYSSTKKSTKKIIGVFFLVFTCWNIYQLTYFFQNAANSNQNTWLFPKNLPLIPFGVLLPIHVHIGEFEVYDPTLKNKLLDQHQKTLSNYDNQAVITNQCTKAVSFLPEGIAVEKERFKLPFQIKNYSLESFYTFKGLLTKNLFLCMETYLNNAGISALILDSSKRLVAAAPFQNSSDIKNTIFTMPFNNGLDEKSPGNGGGDWELFLGAMQLGTTKTSSLEVKSLKIITYKYSDLPIKILSFTPYTAVVNTPVSNTYLYVFKEYFPGYHAKVNGKTVPVLSTKDRMIIIPLKQQGFNKVELSFQQIPLMRFAFYLSSISWCLLILYLLFFTQKIRPYKKY